MQPRENEADASCIYRVPENLRERDVQAFVPRIVSLGPYHRHEEQIRQMDDEKSRILDFACQRHGLQRANYRDAIREVFEEAKACYEGPINLSNEEFVEMMMLDGTFVLELLRRRSGEVEDAYDKVFSNRTKVQYILEDMMKLENQLPLSILERLRRLQLGDRDPNKQVTDLVTRLFSRLVPTVPLSQGSRGLHCLDVLRIMSVPANGDSNSAATAENEERIPCVTELQMVGVKFRRKKTGPICNITFNKGTLEIPQVWIFDCSKLLFLNLIAYEQRRPCCGNTVTSYAVFMDSLINSANDVAHLRNHRIIAHWLGSNAEVANLFNNLCKEVIINNSTNCFSNLSKHLNQYSMRKCNTWLASLKQRYFNDPWAYFAFFAATYLLVLSTVQTFYAVYSYHHPKKN